MAGTAPTISTHDQHPIEMPNTPSRQAFEFAGQRIQAPTLPRR